MDSVDNALLKVLLVEDDEDDYVIIRDLLSEMERFELEWVTDYDDALKAIERKEHDVCLLDYRLGERSGLELLREALGRGYKVPIILLTGQGDREVDLEAGDAGQRARRRADLGREVGQRGEVVPERRGLAREAVARQLHPVAGVAREANRDAVDALDALLRPCHI